ncbi:SH3 domain-containing protein [Streptomyces sp. RFCAC02]|uniref:SH3 domain-containing protein n=1 Tax=Streptomyces sp. RFCAC02 TaxID=2499143 RepID=UPI001F0D6393|nr:SH3 domain-containing protein [Streptomyces sp. RFCAC02]
MKDIRRSVVLGTSAALLAFGLGTAPGAVAAETAAAACTHPDWSNKDAGVGSLEDGRSSAPLHSGPNAGCPVVGEALFYMDIYYHCYVFNSAGNTWSHVRAYNHFDDDSINGWIWDPYLEDVGSTRAC